MSREQPEQIATDNTRIVDADPAREEDGETLHSYPEPVEKLLTYGTPETVEMEDWPDYLASGITAEHIPALLRMLADPAFYTSDPDEEDPKYWAAVHTWRTLGQLRDASTVEPLLQQTEGLFDDKSGVDEWAIEELPDVYEAIGPTAIPILTRCIADPAWPVDTRVNAMTGLTKICLKYPEYRDEVVAFFTKLLEHYAQNDPEINSYLITKLSYLKAIEILPLIQTVFADGNVDTFLVTLEDVEVAFGLKEYPEPDFNAFNTFFERLSHLTDQENSTPVSPASLPQPRAQQNVTQPYSSSTPKANKNKKTKKAQAKASRKKNRKK